MTVGAHHDQVGVHFRYLSDDCIAGAQFEIIEATRDTFYTVRFEQLLQGIRVRMTIGQLIVAIGRSLCNRCLSLSIFIILPLFRHNVSPRSFSCLRI